jgi:hypothetical protein
MKALDKVKGVLRWGPGVTATLERIDAIDARLPMLDVEEQALTGPVPRDEHAERIQAWIRRLGAAFVSGRSGPYDFAPSASSVLEPLSRATDPKDPDITNQDDAWRILVWLLGDELVAAVPRALAMQPDAGGLRSTERAPIIAKLKAERAALLLERRQLVIRVHEESEQTVTIEQRPETQAEIAAETRAAELKAQKDRDREWVEEQKRLGRLGTVPVHHAHFRPGSPR